MAVERGVTAKIKLDGEAEYKQALKEISNDLSMCSSEMKKTTAEYANNADSVEALTARSEVLEKQLTSQEQKIALIRDRLKQATEANGEADEGTQKLQRDLNNAEAEFYNTANAIEKNNEALEEAKEKEQNLGEATTNLGDLLDGVAEKFGVTIPDNIKTSLNEFGSFSTGAVVAVGAVTTAVVGLIEVYKKLIDMTTESASNADNILTLSQVTGLDTDTIQELEYASELIDVSFDTIQGAMAKMTRSLDEAQSGTGDVAEAYTKLGVAVTDSTGNFRDSEDIFSDLVDALGAVDNATERDNLSMTIFGKSAQELNPLIVQGSKVLREYTEEAKENSAVLSKDQLNALGSVDDAYQRLQNTQEATKNQMASELAPAVETFYETWTELIKTASDSLINSGVLDYLGSILDSVIDILSPIGELIATVLPQLFVVLKPVAEVLALIADTVNVLVGLLTFDFDKVGTALGLNISSGQMSNIQSLHYSSSQGYSGYTYDEEAGGYVGNYYNAAGDDNWRGGLTWVGENGPELVSLPAGSRISTAQESRDYGGDTFNITIDAKSVKEFNDIVAVAKQARITARMRG